MDVNKLKIGDVLKFGVFHHGADYIPNGDHWGIVTSVNEPYAYIDGVIFTRAEDGKWSSRNYYIGGEDVFTLAFEADIPDDIPDDFWPTVARYKLLGEDA